MNEVSLITDEDAEVIFRSYKQENKLKNIHMKAKEVELWDHLMMCQGFFLQWLYEYLHLFNSF